MTGMTEELELADRLMHVFLPDEEAYAMIRAYGDRRVEAARARIAELEAQLASIKDECADRAVAQVRSVGLSDRLNWTKFEDDQLRAAIKGEPYKKCSTD